MTVNTTPIEVTVRRNALAGWIADRPVGVKNLISVGLVALVAIGVGVLSIVSMSRLSTRVGELKTEHLESVAALVVVRQGVSENYRGQALSAWSAYDPTLGPQAKTARANGDKLVDDGVTALQERTASSPARAAAVQAFATAWASYSNMRNVV